MYVDASSHKDLDRRIDATLKENGICILTDAIDAGLVQRIQYSTVCEFDQYVGSHAFGEFVQMGRFQRKLVREQGRDIFEIRTEGLGGQKAADNWALQYKLLLSGTESLQVVLDRVLQRTPVKHPSPFSRMRYQPERELAGHVDDTAFAVMMQSINADRSVNDDLWIKQGGEKKFVHLRRNDLLLVPGEKGRWDPVYHGARKVRSQERFAFILGY